MNYLDNYGQGHKTNFTPDSRPTPTDFKAWSGMIGLKKHQLWLKSVYIRDQPPLYPRLISTAKTIKSRSSRPTQSFQLIDLHDQPPIYSWYKYHAGHTRKASRISKTAVDNCGKGVGNFYLS